MSENNLIQRAIADSNEFPSAPFDRKGWPWEQLQAPNLHVENLKARWPKITIVTPSFNQGNFLEQTMRSVLLQNYPNLEYIVMDGGSADNSLEIIEKYRALLSYYQSKPDGGQAKAIQEGFKRATGEIYGYLNSDDILYPGALHHIATMFQRSPGIGVVYGNRKVVNENDVEIGRHIWPYFFSRYHWARGQPLAQECCFWRQEIYWKVGGIDPDKFFILDYDLFYRMWMISRFRKTRAYLGALRMHAETKNTKFLDVCRQEMAQAKAQFSLRDPGYFRIRIMNRIDYLQVLFDNLSDRIFGSKLPQL